MCVDKLNLANSIYEGFNDQGGLMICGYEWGAGGDDSVIFSHSDDLADCTFSNKVPRYGEIAESWVYDKRIRDWLIKWGGDLNRVGSGSDFDKSIVQTNWSLGSRPESLEISFYKNEENVKNFIYHVKILKPSIILFMGSGLLTKCLKYWEVRDKFVEVCGGELGAIKPIPMDGYTGPLAYIQLYEKCKVIGLPHPSGSRGLTNNYVDFLSKYMTPIIKGYKENNKEKWRGFSEK